MADDDALYRTRQGFWLRMARERAGKSQAGAAEYLGLSKNSKSTVSDYENGVTEVPLRYLRALARWYGVPLSVFTEPNPTAFETLEEIAIEAIGSARAQASREAGGDPAADAQQSAPLRERVA
jgi:transcriptional regulator with XRE-family HTH domain